MDIGINVLTEKQQAVWDLKQQGLTKRQIAERLGISVGMVTTHLNNADRRFQQYEKFKALEAKNNEIVDMEFTRGELELIVQAFTEYQHVLMKKVHFNVNTDWRGRLPYGAELSQQVSAKIQKKLYGKVLYDDLLSAPQKHHNSEDNDGQE